MSLNVSAKLLDRAERGPVDDADFIACVRESLPYAWQVISGVVADLERSATDLWTLRASIFPENSGRSPSRVSPDTSSA